MKHAQAKPSSTKMDKAQNVLLIAFLLGIFIGAMDTGIISPARTVIENNLHITPDHSIWIITLYTLVYAIAMPISGRLSDLYGKKRVYTFSIMLFMIGSLLCGISDYYHSFTALLLFRALQAVGGGGIMPVATAYIAERFPIEKRGMALGLVGAIYGIATLLGPSLGSFILQFAGDKNWGLLFFINVPICLVAILIVAFAKTPETTQQKVKIDVISALLLAVTIASLMYAVSNVNFANFSKTIRDFNVWFFLLLWIIFLPILIIYEKRNKQPILRLSYFSQRDSALTMAIAFLVGCGMMGLIFVPQFAENTLKLKPGAGGYVVTIIAVCAGLAGPIGGKIIDMFSSKIVLVIGFLTTIAASLLIAFVVVPYTNVAMLYVCCALMGFGMGFTMGTPLNYLIQLFAPKGESGSAQSTLSLIRSIGVALSPNILIGFISGAAQKMPSALATVMPSLTMENMPAPASGGFQAGTELNASNAFARANVTNIIEVIKNYADTVIAQAPLPQNSDKAALIASMQRDYSAKLAQLAPQIEDTFQKTVNSGFAGLFLAIGASALLALILTFFLTGKEKELKKAEKAQSASV